MPLLLAANLNLMTRCVPITGACQWLLIRLTNISIYNTGSSGVSVFVNSWLHKTDHSIRMIHQISLKGSEERCPHAQATIWAQLSRYLHVSAPWFFASTPLFRVPPPAGAHRLPAAFAETLFQTCTPSGTTRRTCGSRVSRSHPLEGACRCTPALSWPVLARPRLTHMPSGLGSLPALVGWDATRMGSIG